MFRVAKVVKSEIMVLNKDLYKVTERLGHLKTIEIIPNSKINEKWNQEEIISAENHLSIISNTAKNLNIKLNEKPKHNKITLDNAKLLLTSINNKLDPLLKKNETLNSELNELKRSYNELKNFQQLDMDFSQINNISFLYFKYGSVPVTRLSELKSQINNRTIILDFKQKLEKNNRTAILAITSKKGRFSLETSLNKTSFKEIIIPEELAGVPSKIISRLKNQIENKENKIKETTKKIEKLSNNSIKDLNQIYNLLKIHIKILKTAQHFTHTEYTSTIKCWIPKAKINFIKNELDKLTSEKVVIETTDPIKMPKEERKKLKIPIILHNRKSIKPFEFLISNYGYPKYGEIEPTPILAVGFITMFGIMFGDVGQGSVLLLIGLIMAFKKRLSENIKSAGMLISYAGLSSIFFGIIYGSVFCNQHLIKPLWKEPLHDIMTLFAGTIVFGILWISVGLLLNLINKFKLRDYKSAIFEKTGLFGIIFYWGSLFIIVSMAILKNDLPSYTFIILIGIPLLLIFIKDPLYNAFRKKPLFEHGIFSTIMEGLVEIIETVSSFMGNTVSFVRVGAFALAHSGLSLAIIKLAELVGHGIPGIIIMIFGNILIILLEGMVVTIQTLRLEYYEFFSKFYSGDGRPFKPFSLI